ncbi:hypothetical protein FQA39_LY05207 [Lamprigera yunnana]|nr:hypothetical protein FQA39_LY05207 [Lamprigera yunnana]
MKLQIFFFFFFLGIAFAKFVCEDGVPYIENECNGCFCNKGVLGCTLMGCLGARHKELENCEVGTSYEKECNKCVCDESLKTICTNYKC